MRFSKRIAARTGVSVFRNAVCVPDGLRDECVKRIERYGETVFNPDALRQQAVFPRQHGFVRALNDVLIGHGLMKHRRFGGGVALISYPKCKRQKWHIDFDPQTTSAAHAKPLGVIVALDDTPTRFLTLSKTYTLRKGDILTFEGDVVHAGADYEYENVRMHVYLDVRGVKRKRNKTWIVTERG